MGRIAVLTSGGDAPGMNAALRAVVRSAVFNEVSICGIEHGYRGIFDNQIRALDRYSVADIIHKGGTILYTDRCAVMETENGPQNAAELLHKYDIDSLIVIGGDGTFHGAQALARCGIKVVAVPATIDNDVNCRDRARGFDTALNTAIEAIGRIRDTSSSHNRINVVQVMGRDCGDLALYSGLAGGAEYILVPEMPYDINDVAAKIMKGKEKGKMHSIVVFAEGCGDAKEICTAIQNVTDIETRATILGYTQRGGAPTAFDRILASRMGEMAVDMVLRGEVNHAVCYRGGEYISMPLDEALEYRHDFNTKVYETAMKLSV